MNLFNLLFISLFLFLSIPLFGQRQYADTLYRAPIDKASYERDSGPVIAIDESHNNFHTVTERYQPFANVLRQDGYSVVAYKGDFSIESLTNIDVLVISNALHASNVGQWKLPNPSAFSDVEIQNLVDWVSKGGSLFLIADHMPFAGAAQKLAASFDYTFLNGFAEDSAQTGSDLFCRANGSLVVSSLSDGMNSGYWLDSIRSFTGQAFQIPDEAIGILKCGDSWISRQPEIPWQFDETTPIVSVADWYQGAYQPFGLGKLVVFGEAAMFSAQTIEMEDRIFYAGMNRPNAKFNYKLLINLVHWLDH